MKIFELITHDDCQVYLNRLTGPSKMSLWQLRSSLHVSRTSTPGSRRCTCVDVGRGARRSVPARQCKARTAMDRVPTLAARRTVRTVSATGDCSTRPAVCDQSGTSVRMCGIQLKDRLPSKELRDRLGIEDIALVLQQNRLRWYGMCCEKMMMIG